MNCDDIIDELILHEIIGTTTNPGATNDLTIFDEGSLVVSGVNQINFTGTGITATSTGLGAVKVKVPDIQVDGNILWVYDVTRSKWLSSFRTSLGAGEKGRVKNKYLLVFDGQATNLTGWRIVRDGTITAISAQTRDLETWTLRIRKNGNVANAASLVMNNVDGNHSNVTNVDISEGDQLQFFADTTGFFGVKDVLIWIEIAWRNNTLAAP